MRRNEEDFSIEVIHLTRSQAKTVESRERAGFVMVADGAAHCAGLETCVLSINEYYILSPNDSATFANRAETSCTLWVLLFDKGLLDDMQAPGEDLWSGFYSLPRRYMNAMNRSNMIMREMFQNVFVNRITVYEHTYARLHAGFSALICLRTCLGQPVPEKPVVQPPLTMTDVYQYVRAHLSDDLSVRAIARALHFNPSYLAHVFREKAGTTLHQYVLSRRLNYANVLLKQGVSVNSTAERSGFASAVSFIRAYKRRFGFTPGAGGGAERPPENDHAQEAQHDGDNV